jgi:hypothetical protein
MYFLRTHDFGGGFDGHFFKVLDAISAEWVGPRYGFEDAEMRAIWDDFFPKNRQLLKLMAQYTTRGATTGVARRGPTKIGTLIERLSV